MIAPLPAVAPSEDVAVVLQAAGIGALLGTAVAARRRTRTKRVDTWVITTRWTVAAAALGVLLVVLLRVL